MPFDVRMRVDRNCNLEMLIKSGRFREYLYYRLSVVTSQLPTLAERSEDIPELIYHFLKRSNARNKRNIQITAEAVQSLSRMSWPGNVRELENFIERLAIFCASGEIGVADVEREAGSKRQFVTPTVAGNGSASTLEEMERRHS